MNIRIDHHVGWVQPWVVRTDNGCDRAFYTHMEALKYCLQLLENRP